MPLTRTSILDALSATVRTATGFRQLIYLTCTALILSPVYCNPFQERLDSAQKPDWLTMGPDLSPEIIPQKTASNFEFRDPYGGAKLLIAPLKNLEIDGVRVDSAPEGEPNGDHASLNPARNRLIITRGIGSFYVSVKIGKKSASVNWKDRTPLPQIHYGEAPRFFIGSWIWLDDSIAISPGGIYTKDQHNYALAGLFIFDINSKTMRRVNLKELDIGTHPVLRITGVNPHARMIRITLDDEDPSGKYRERTFFLKIPGE